LAGDHQRQNAALAIEVARALGVAGSAMARGLRAATWPGRLERVLGRPAIVLDGAHNGASADALARALRRERRGRRLVLVVGINRDKDARAVLAPLVRIAAAVVVTRSASPRAAIPVAIARLAARGTRVPVSTAPDISTALAAARADAGPDGIVCVTGSLALAGDARTALGLRPVERFW
jgi:dihydrofolate synthase/folylpolyglutamate synthase